MAKISENMPDCMKLTKKEIKMQIKLLGYRNQTDMEQKMSYNPKGFSGLSDMTRATILFGYILDKYEIKNSLELFNILHEYKGIKGENDVLRNKLIKIREETKGVSDE